MIIAVDLGLKATKQTYKKTIHQAFTSSHTLCSNSFGLDGISHVLTRLSQCWLTMGIVLGIGHQNQDRLSGYYIESEDMLSISFDCI